MTETEIAKVIDGSDPIATLSKNYLEGREKLVLAKHEAELLKRGGDDAVVATLRKQRKLLNEKFTMGYSSDDIKNFSHDEFMDKVADKIESEKSALKGDVSKAIQKEIDEYKMKLSNKSREYDEIKELMHGEIEKATKEKEDFVREYEAKSYFNKLVLGDEELADVRGKDFFLKAIEKEIFENYSVEKDGKISKKDGGVALHPEKDVVLEKVDELYSFLKGKAGIVKQSNSGSHAFLGGKIGERVTNNSELSENQKRMKASFEAAKKSQTF